HSLARSASTRQCSMRLPRFMTRPKPRGTPKRMSARCTRCWRGAPACRPGNRRTGHMLSDAQRVAYQRDGFIVVPEVFSPAEIDELRRVTDEFVRNSVSVAANDEIYDLEDTHSPQEPRVRRLKAPQLHH